MRRPSDYRVLVACEHTGALASLFYEAGYVVASLDLKPQVCPWDHYQMDIRNFSMDSYDIMVAFPPCTYLAKAQWHLCLSNPDRLKKCLKAVEFVKYLYDYGPSISIIENPSGMLSRFWRKPNVVVYPYQFGDPYRKEINLWLKGVNWPMPTSRLRTGKPIENHVNGRMSQEQKSEIKSSWLHFPGLSRAVFNVVHYRLMSEPTLFDL